MVLRPVNRGLRFLLEVLALLAIAYWGFESGDSLPVSVALGLAAPLSVAVVWGVFGSPQAAVPVSDRGRLLLEGLVFGAATAGLYAVGQPILAGLFAALVVANHAFMRLWDQ
ncbi:YrdB family protein [Haloarchaeobius litoreus]|uniref:YrdB family protein n=1 Tax=Haloarchaeobius litoreus TaxID=755306 RepID=A0ABD6DIG4_9EURY|nr:YrdB family protein [Haloarchaeobius litoreus]